jgi:Icc-related predicted phosphoesterase
MTWLPAPHFRKFALLVIVLLLAVLAVLQLARMPHVESLAIPVIVLQPARYPFTFVGFGDTRFTNPVDKLNSNAAARRAMVDRIADEKPQFLVLNGDLVFNGDKAGDWAVYDRETEKLRDAGIKIFPVLGNHDLADDESGAFASYFRHALKNYGWRRVQSGALANYFQRFPEIQERRWYSLRAGNVLLFMLDSNSDQNPSSAQRQWLVDSLSGVPREVDFVVLVMHHPPYTKSSEHPSGEGHMARPQELSLTKMLEERQKTLRRGSSCWPGMSTIMSATNTVGSCISSAGVAAPHLTSLSARRATSTQGLGPPTITASSRWTTAA